MYDVSSRLAWLMNQAIAEQQKIEAQGSIERRTAED
jgi:hypothetical protein